MRSTLSLRIVCSQLIFFSACMSAHAWVYPEHRDIALKAVLKLDSSKRHVLSEIWSQARVGHEERLPAYIVIPTQPERPRFIDWAAWTAIGGDHSCSPEEMVRVILTSDWILDVAAVTERLKRKLSSAQRRSDRVNALRDQDIELQRADPEYATRAGSNNVHFLLPRDNASTTIHEFVLSSLVQGDEINAMGAYIWYHYRALAKAKRIRSAASAEQRSKLALAALADEAYGLHFLEDVFAAGHVAGTWGNASLRKGTHDYYNEHGLETATWTGKPLILLGDAYMTSSELEAPSELVKQSLEQLIAAYVGEEPYASHDFQGSKIEGVDRDDPDTLNTCSNIDMPGPVASVELKAAIISILGETPMPALKSGVGELPRFRTELGGFIGLAPYIRSYAVSGGFDEQQAVPGAIGGMGMILRLGLGLDGVTSESGDGLVFADIGMSFDNASTNSFTSTLGTDVAGSIVAAIPARSSISTRIRLPFWLIPGDLILGALVVAPFSFTTYTQMAVVAGNGGLIPWQAGIATPIGRLQFILGREIGLNIYGTGTPDRVFVSRQFDSLELAILEFKSVQLEFPIVELRPFRTFSVDQSSSLVFQFYTGVDIPTQWSVITDVTYQPQLHTIVNLGVRMSFDWRYYF
jgi:hypothetical protein